MADPQSMVAYYAARAAQYDRIYQKPERQADLAQLRQMLPPLFAGQRVLEVACGTGYWTQYIAPVAEQVLALDAAPETMAIAAHRVPIGKVQFMTGDAYALPQDQGRFGAAFAGFWFSHVPMARQRDFLAGLAAVLEPGARIVLLDNRYVEGSSTPIADTDAEHNTYQLRSLDDGSSHRVLKNFPGEQRLRQVLDGLAGSIVITELDYFWVLQGTVVARAG